VNQINIGVIVALLSATVTLFVSWLLRRDSTTARHAAESARIDELTRRVRALETDSVSQAEFSNLTARLDEIRTDIREIRNRMEDTRK
jgi:hypothetical protein